MAKVKNEDEKTEQAVGATVNVNPEDVKLQAFLEAEVEKLNVELEAARVRIAELEAQLEQAARGAVEAAEAQERYQAGGEAAADAEVVAVKSKHGHAFWRSGYAEKHKAAMLKAENPLEYDYSGGWTASYEQIEDGETNR